MILSFLRTNKDEGIIICLSSSILFFITSIMSVYTEIPFESGTVGYESPFLPFVFIMFGIIEMLMTIDSYFGFSEKLIEGKSKNIY